jgi:hypothetical protein
MPVESRIESAADDKPVPALSWETDIPIATHPVMLANFALLFVITGLVTGALLTFILAMIGQVADIQVMWERTGVTTLVLFLLSLFVATIVFGNRLPMRFRLDSEAAESEMTDSRARTAQRAAKALSWMAGRFGLAGAGLIAETSARQHILWSAVARAHFHPLLRTISLSNGWRTVLILFCNEQNYEAVAAAVHKGVAARELRRFASPLPQLLLRTFLVLLCSMPLFAIPYVEKDGVLPALLVFCFGLAAVWLEQRFAWLATVGLAWMTSLVLIALFKSRDSLFGGTYQAYQVLDIGDLVTLALAAAGAGYLLWLFASLLRGQVRSGLAGDSIESGHGGTKAMDETPR